MCVCVRVGGCEVRLNIEKLTKLGKEIRNILCGLNLISRKLMSHILPLGKRYTGPMHLGYLTRNFTEIKECEDPVYKDL